MKICNVFIPLAITAGLSLAQQGVPPAASPGAHGQAMTGCLSKGSGANEYLLTNEKGEQTVLISAEDLSKHVAHKVRVTGAPDKEKDKQVLRVEGVEHVADSCS